MSLCKSGQIQTCCHPNALMTLKEYLMDYSSKHTADVGNELIMKEVGNVPDPKVRGIVIRNLKNIADGRRDFRF
jgi:2-iminoacetate synthase